MQKKAGNFLKSRRFWIATSVFAVAIAAVSLLGVLLSRPAVAAGNIDWLNYGVLEFEGKTYVLQKRDFNGVKGASYLFDPPFDDHMGYGEQDSGLMSVTNSQSVIYAPVGTQTCIDKNNKEYFYEYLRFNVGLNLNDSFSKGTYFKVNESDKDSSGNLNCTFPTGVNATSNNVGNRRIWFFKEGDKVYSFDKAVSFTKSGTGPGGVELYYRDNDAVAPVNGVACKDLLVDTGGGKWVIFPMAPANVINTNFTPGRNAVSESYDSYLSSGGRTTANCRVDSLELRSTFMAGIIAHTGVHGRDSSVACPANIPGSVNFDGQDGKRDYYVVACRDGTGERKIIDYIVMQGNMVRYHDADFTPSGGDDGYVLVKGVSNRVPKATPASGAGAVTTPGATPGGSADTRPLCALGDYMGWLLCGAATLADSTVSVIQDIIISFLDITPINLNDPNDPVFRISSISTSIANIIGIILLGVILFSQGTSLGVRNYGLKALGFRFIALMVMANMSIYIAAIAIDATNVGVRGMLALLESIIGSAGLSMTGLEVPAGTGAPEKILITGVGAGVFSFLIKAKGVEAIVIPLLIMGLLLLVSVGALVLRHVVVDIIAAVLAILIVLKILPGTSSIADKGISLGTKALALGLFIPLAFAGGQIAAAFIIAMVPPGAGVGTRTFLFGLALGAKWVVLGAVPFLVTAGGAAIAAPFKWARGVAEKAGEGLYNTRGVRMRSEAREAAKNKAYLDRLTGVRGGPRATLERLGRRASMSRFMGGSADAQRELEERLFSQRQKLDSEKIQNLQKRMTRNAAVALASNDYDASTGTVYKTDPKSGARSVDVQLNAEDMEAVRYAQRTGLAQDVVGAKAIGGHLAELGDLTRERAQTLISRGSSEQEYNEINNALNSASLAAKQPQMGYNLVSPDGKLILGGIKANGGNEVDGLRGIMKGKTIADLPKEAYNDDYYPEAAVQTVVREMHASLGDDFIRQTLSINDQKRLEGIATAMDPKVAGGTEAQRLAWLMSERKRVYQQK